MNLILLGLGGSRAYGTAVEGSDYDFRGVCLQSKSDLLGTGNFESYAAIDKDLDTDYVIYGINKFFKMAMQCNPNVIEILGYENYDKVEPLGQLILDSKHLFFSQQTIKSFGGFINHAKNDLRKQLDKNKRNKTAAHAIRILNMGTELIGTGELNVYRPNYRKLLDIRADLYSSDSIWNFIDDAESDFEYAIKNTVLPKECPRERIEKLLININRQSLQTDVDNTDLSW